MNEIKLKGPKIYSDDNVRVHIFSDGLGHEALVGPNSTYLHLPHGTLKDLANARNGTDVERIYCNITGESGLPFTSLKVPAAELGWSFCKAHVKDLERLLYTSK